MDLRPRRRGGVDWQQLPDGSMVLYDAARARAYPISESAAIIWRACDGTRSTAAIVDELAALYDAPVGQIASDVDAFLARLREIELLDSIADPPA